MPIGPLQVSVSPLRRFADSSRAAATTTLSLLALVGFNLLQTASLLVRPFSRSAFRRINRWCANVWWGWCVFYAEKVNGTRLALTGEDLPCQENAIVVCNHQQMPDITTIMIIARRKQRLGDLKWFVKRSIMFVPGVGWGMRFLNCLYVRRNWASDREAVLNTFATINNERIPLWLVSFVEGTRSTGEKIHAAQAFARSRGIEPTRHVLLPRTSGFAASVQGLAEHLDAVYDFTIGYVDGVPTLWQYIKGQVPLVHVHVRRYPIAELPQSEQDLKDWLTTRFLEKDDLLDHYFKHGSFPASASAFCLPGGGGRKVVRKTQ